MRLKESDTTKKSTPKFRISDFSQNCHKSFVSSLTQELNKLKQVCICRKKINKNEVKWIPGGCKLLKPQNTLAKLRDASEERALTTLDVTT